MEENSRFSFEFLEEFGKAFVPKRIRPKLSGYLATAGYDTVPYKFFGLMFVATLIITYAVYIPLVYPNLKGMSPGLFFVGTFLAWAGVQILAIVVIMLSTYFYLNIKIYQRTKLLEDLLPEYLALVSTNLKGGMNFERSLWSAIKSEFGILSKEIGIASKKVATGNDVIEALEDFAQKYKSPILRRTVDLLKGEITSGGRVADVIDSIVDNLRKTRALKQEMVATSLSYMIFMAAIVIVITPALFALAKQLLVIILSLGNKLSGVQTTNSIISFQAANISPAEFTAFSIAAISIIAIFTSMIISIIEKGDIIGGIKFLPLFLICAVILYFVFAISLEMLMKGLVIV